MSTIKPYPQVLQLQVFEHLQEWWLHHFPGKPIPVLNNPFCEEIFH